MTPDAPPSTVSGMDEIRAAIDALDRRIVPLLAARLAWVRRAAAFKETRADVVVPWRIEDVAGKAAACAAALGADPAPVEEIYRRLMDVAIAEEGREWDALHARPADGEAVDA